jgi:hypothetical protein
MVVAFSDEVEVDIAQGRQEGIGIVDRVAISTGVADLEQVIGVRVVDVSFEET